MFCAMRLLCFWHIFDTKKFLGTNGPGCYIGSGLEHHLFKFWMLMHRTINVNLPECLKMVDLRSTGGNSAWVRALQLAL